MVEDEEALKAIEDKIIKEKVYLLGCKIQN